MLLEAEKMLPRSPETAGMGCPAGGLRDKEVLRRAIALIQEMEMKKLLLICGIAGCLLLPGAVRAKGLRIGVVDMKRAVAETKEGKAANARLKRLKQKLEAELNRKLKEFYAKQAKLQKAMSILKDDEKRKRIAESRKEFEVLQKRYLQAERQLMSKQTQALLKIQKKLAKVIQKLAKRDGYDYIFNGAAILWAPRHTDLTNEVIRQYNK
jgi:outer membrane protein